MRIFPRLLVAGALALSALAAPLSASAAAPRTWTVTTGGSPDDSVEAKVFGPSQITIDAGDSVTWHIGSKEPHTISFGWPAPINPASPAATAPVPGTSFSGTGKVSSGLLFGNYSLSFPKAGTYSYLCLIHPGMAGQVVVQPAGSAYPATQAQLSAQGQQQIQAAVARTQALVAGAHVTKMAGANGATTWTVPASVGSGDASAERFIGGNLTIKAGDTVTWVDKDPTEPHTVTFLAGTPAPKPGDPREFAPSGGHVYNGSGFINSGLYGPIPGAPKSYSLTFLTPGNYSYVCLLHAELGMVGDISVVGAAPAQAPVQAPAASVSGSGASGTVPAALPSTGGGGDAPAPWGMAGFAAVLLGGGATFVAWRRRRA